MVFRGVTNPLKLLGVYMYKYMYILKGKLTVEVPGGLFPAAASRLEKDPHPYNYLWV